MDNELKFNYLCNEKNIVGMFYSESYRLLPS